MAQRVHELCALVAAEYDGHAERVWTRGEGHGRSRASDPRAPGFGDMKVVGLGSTLAKRLGVKVAEPLVRDRLCLGDVDSPEALEAYQAAKRAKKAAARREEVAKA